MEEYPLASDVEAEGFLSTQAKDEQKLIEVQFADPLAEAKAASMVAMAAFGTLPEMPTWPLPLMVAVGMSLRAMSAFQGAVILLERGMPAEGQILLRGGLDHLFFAGAIAADLSVFDRLADNDKRHRLLQAKKMLELHEAKLHLQLQQKHVDDLEQLVAEMEGKMTTISTEHAAKSAGLEALYQVMYRGLSYSACHPSLRGLDFVLDVGQEDGGLTFGPSGASVAWTLGLAKSCFSATAVTLGAISKALEKS